MVVLPRRRGPQPVIVLHPNHRSYLLSGQAHHRLRFNRIEQDVTLWKRKPEDRSHEGKTKSGTQRPTLAKTPQGGASR
jgi:hypothetical protein